MPAPRKPVEQLRKRNRAELWTVLPPEGCKSPVPRWPTGAASKDEAALWRKLWQAPLAAWWHEQRIEPSIVARYVRLALGKPAHASVSQLENALGLTPSAMQRMRLVVEAEEEPPKAGADTYRHLLGVVSE